MTEEAASSTVPPVSALNERINERLTEVLTPKNIELLRESCIFNILSHGAMGFVFGGAIGLFLSGMSTTGPEFNMGSTAAASATQSLPFRAQVKQVFKEMGGRTWSSAKSFAGIAALFTGFECAVESYRAKHDLTNTIIAGCLTGGTLAAKSGPKSALFGCAGFAAFSAAVEHFLQDRPSTEDAD